MMNKYYGELKDNGDVRDAQNFGWQLLNSEHIVKDRWISLRADTCKMPNGRIVTPYYVYEYPTWVNVVAVTKQKEVVLVEQYRHGCQKTLLELPSGGMELTDKSPVEAIKRELAEETGYTGEEFIHILFGGMGMKNILRKDKFLNVAAILLVVGFIIRLGADYYKYQNSFNSAPFSVSIIIRSIEFLLPSIICVIAAAYVKKLSRLK